MVDLRACCVGALGDACGMLLLIVELLLLTLVLLLLLLPIPKRFPNRLFALLSSNLLLDEVFEGGDCA